MADQKDSNDTPVGLTDAEIERLVSIGDAARRVMDQFAPGMGKTFTFEPFERDTAHELKVDHVARGGTSFVAMMALFDHQTPGMTVLFTDGLSTDTDGE